MFNRIAFAVASVFVASSALAATSTGTVTFTGKVITSACSIQAGSSSVELDFGEVEVGKLREGNGESGHTVNTDITLSNCSAKSLASITLSDSAGNAKKTLQNTATAADGVDPATGVGVLVSIKTSDAAASVVDFSTDEASRTYELNGGELLDSNYKFNIAGQLVREADVSGNAVTPGLVKAQVAYTITYK